MLKAIIWFLQGDTFKSGDQKSALIRENRLYSFRNYNAMIIFLLQCNIHVQNACERSHGNLI